MKYQLMIVLAAFVFQKSFCQTGILQDDDGSSSILLTGDNPYAININAAEKSVSFSVADQSVFTVQRVYFAGQLKVSGKEGKFPVFKKRQATYEGELNISMIAVGGDAADYGYVTGKYALSRINLAKRLANGTLSLDNISTSGASIQVGYNNEKLFGSASNVILGIAVESGVKDNLKDLDQFEFREVKFAGKNANGDSSFVSTEVENTYLKSEFSDRQFFIKPMIDLGYAFPTARLLPMLHFRWDTYPGSSLSNNVFTPGIGLYLTELDTPSKVILGLQLFFNDWSDSSNEGNSRADRASLNFVMGFKL